MNRISDQSLEKYLSLIKGDINNHFRLISSNLINKRLSDFKDSAHLDWEIFETAKEIKVISSRVDELIHAYGILKCLPKILSRNEKIISISLGANASDSEFDLVTSLRIAEFKFSKDYLERYTGIRRRKIFEDFCKLLMSKSHSRKQLYVYNASQTMKFLKGRSEWENVLSKNVQLTNSFREYLHGRKMHHVKLVRDLPDIEMIEIIEIPEIDVVEHLLE